MAFETKLATQLGGLNPALEAAGLPPLAPPERAAWWSSIARK